MLDWYRADRTERIRGVLGLASMLVVTGAVIAATAIRFGHGLGYAALVLVASGGAVAIAGLRRELLEERWLALRSDGLVYARDGRTRRVGWRHIEDVRVDGARLVVTLRSGRTIELRDRFAGITRAALAEKIAHQRRRAAHGLRG
jgi:hypothetical protein